MIVELTKEDIKKFRDYFAEHEKSSFEHWAYSVFETALNRVYEFKDLELKGHPAGLGLFDKQAEMNFDNNYGVSVITGKGAYTNATKPYEVAVLYNGEICYDSGITDDVIGYCGKKRVTEIMKQVQELNPKIKQDE